MKKILLLIPFVLLSCSKSNKDENNSLKSQINPENTITYSELTVDSLNELPNNVLNLEAGFPETAVQPIVVKNVGRTSLALNKDLLSISAIPNLVVEDNCPESLNRFGSCSIKLSYSPSKEDVASENNSITILGKQISISLYNTYVEEDLALKDYSGEATISSNLLNIGTLKEGELKKEFITIRNRTRNNLKLPDFSLYNSSNLNTFSSTPNVIVTSDCPEELPRLSACRVYIDYSVSSISVSESLQQELSWENSFFNLTLNSSVVFEDTSVCSENSGLSLNSSLLSELETKNKVIIPVRNTTRSTQSLCLENVPHYIEVTEDCSSINRLRTCYLTIEKDIDPTDSVSFTINGQEVIVSMTGNDPIPPRFSPFRVEDQKNACTYSGLTSGEYDLDAIFGINSTNALKLINDGEKGALESTGVGKFVKLNNDSFAAFGKFSSTLGINFWTRANSYGLLDGSRRVVDIFNKDIFADAISHESYFLLDNGSVVVFGPLTYSLYDSELAQFVQVPKEEYIQQRIDDLGMGVNNTVNVKKIFPAHAATAFLLTDGTVRVVPSSFNQNGTNDGTITNSGASQSDVNSLGIGQNPTEASVVDIHIPGGEQNSKGAGFIAQLSDGSLRIWGRGAFEANANQNALNSWGIGVNNDKKVKEIFSVTINNPGNFIAIFLLEDGTLRGLGPSTAVTNDNDLSLSMMNGLNERGVGTNFSEIKVKDVYMASNAAFITLEDKSIRILRLSSNLSVPKQDALNKLGVGVRDPQYPVKNIKDIIATSIYEYTLLFESGEIVTFNDTSLVSRLDLNNIKRSFLDENGIVQNNTGTRNVKSLMKLNKNEYNSGISFVTNTWTLLLEDDSILLPRDSVSSQGTLNAMGYGSGGRDPLNPVPVKAYYANIDNTNYTVFYELSDGTFISSTDTINTGFLVQINSRIQNGDVLKNVFTNFIGNRMISFLFESGELFVFGGNSDFAAEKPTTFTLDENGATPTVVNYLAQYQGDVKVQDIDCKIAICETGFEPSLDGKSCTAIP